MAGISSVQVDFNDGRGFRTLRPGNTVSIYYESEGLKTISARITAGGSTRRAKAQFYYRRPKTFVQPDYQLNITAQPVYTSESQYLGGSANRNASVSCSEGTAWERIHCRLELGARIEVENGCDNVFDKPVIIVEGFDPTGNLTIGALRERFMEENFLNTLKAAGYDIVYVDFVKNTDFIENNAKVLENVINWVNQNKAGNHRSSVIGFSMGGLISRWCLKDMEDRGINHQVANYFSYDAPHQGANMSLGMQYIFLEMERDMAFLRFNRSFRDLANANKSPAARQMIVLRPVMPGPYNLGTLDPLRARFAEQLVVKGYPQQTNNYGIAFGRGNNTAGSRVAGNGEQWGGFVPGDQIYEGNLTFFLVNFQSEGYAVPANGNAQVISRYRFQGYATRKIFGLAPVTVPNIRFLNYRYTGQYPYDDAPGGFEATQFRFVNNLNGGNGWANGAAGEATTFGHEAHNFMSTVSALDLQNQGYGRSNNWQSNNLYFPVDNFIQNTGAVNGNTLSDPALSPFRAVVTASSGPSAANINLFHNGGIAQSFSAFILRKILNQIPTQDCQNDSFCDANPRLTGSAIICGSTASYSLANVPNGLTISWSSQSNKVRVSSGQGTPSATFSVNSSGSETIIATITSPCGASRTISQKFWIGAPSISYMGYKGPCYEPYLEYRATSVSGATYAWSINTTKLTVRGNGSSATIWNNGIADGNSQSFVLTVRITQGGCTITKSISGVYRQPTKCDCGYNDPSCGGGGGGVGPSPLSIYPLPADDQITISVESEQGNSEEVIREIAMYNHQQVLVMEESKINKKEFVIDVKKFPKGLYYLQITTQKETRVRQIIIQ